VTEEWRKCEDWPLYAVSDQGRLKRGARILKTTNAECYLWRDGRWYSGVPLAGLILRAFVGPPPSPDQNKARHLNDDRTNNTLGNLAWGTQGDNVRDAVNNGLFAGRVMSPESNEARRIASTGRRHTEETKAKMSISNLRRVEEERELGIKRVKPDALSTAGRVWVTNGVECKLIIRGSPMPDGWYRGRLL